VENNGYVPETDDFSDCDTDKVIGITTMDNTASAITVPFRVSAVERRLLLVPTQDTQRKQIDSLIECNTELAASIRDLNTSWSVERQNLIKDVRDIHDKVNQWANEERHIKEKIDHLEKSIQGDGVDRSVPLRLHSLEQADKYHERQIKEIREKDIKELRDDRKKSQWLFYGTLATLIVGIVLEALRFALEKKILP
jgi:hypothetical protein